METLAPAQVAHVVGPRLEDPERTWLEAVTDEAGAGAELPAGPGITRANTRAATATANAIPDSTVESRVPLLIELGAAGVTLLRGAGGSGPVLVAAGGIARVQPDLTIKVPRVDVLLLKWPAEL